MKYSLEMDLDWVVGEDVRNSLLVPATKLSELANHLPVVGEQECGIHSHKQGFESELELQ